MGEEVKTVFTSDSAQIERVLQRLEEQNAKLIVQNRALVAASRDAASQTESWLSRQANHVTTLVGGYFTLQGAINILNRTYQEWDQSVQRLAKHHGDVASNAASAIAASGDLARGRDVEKFIDAQKLGTREEAIAAYSGVSGGTPGSSLTTRSDLAREALRAAPLVDDLKAFGKLLAEIHDAFPSFSSADVGDLALSLRSKAGADTDKLTSDSFLRSVQSLVESGAVRSPEEGLAYGVGALRANLKPEILSQMVAAVDAQYDLRRPGTGRPYTDSDRAFNRFAQAGASERFRLLREDPTVAQEILGKEAATRGKLISQDEVAQIAASLQADRQGDFTAAELQRFGLTVSGSTRMAQRSNAAAVDASQSLRRQEADAAVRQRAADQFNRWIDANDPDGPNWIHRAAFKFGTAGAGGPRTLAEALTTGHAPARDRFGLLKGEVDIARSAGDSEGLKELKRLLTESLPFFPMGNAWPIADQLTKKDQSLAEDMKMLLQSIDSELKRLNSRPALQTLPPPASHLETR